MITSNSNIHALISAFIVVPLAVVTGCSGSSLVEVTGTVTLDGNPLPDALVIFEPEGRRASTGITGADGTYTLRRTGAVNGCEPGTYAVRISTASTGQFGPDGEPIEAPELVPATYNVESTLTAEVKQVAASFDFALESSQ